ncbi:SusD/RagB family nutrient-binding outer membrane lipoprotein [Nostoc sp. NIES-2111]
MKNSISLLVAGALALSLAGCSYDDKYTTDPNNPADAPIGTVLVQAEVGVGYTYGSDLARYDNQFTQQINGIANQSLIIGHYNFKQQDTDQMWDNLYRALYSFKDVRDKSLKLPAGNGYEYRALAYALMAHSYQVLTDHYGDIPFSDALRGADALQPKFDKQENIYPALHAYLDSAIALSGKTSSLDIYIPGPSSDPIFGGDMTRLKAFAQAMKARLYLHQVKQDPALAQQAYDFATAALASGFTSVKVSFPGDGQTSESPLSQFASQRGDITLCSTLVDSMTKYNDPRIYFYGDSTGFGAVVGAKPGEATTDASPPGSYLNRVDAPIYLFSLSELQFILSEAAFRLTKNDEAATAANAGVTASFAQVGADGVADYLTANGTTTANVSLERIINQKWMSLFLDPEVWTDMRRTGFPVIPAPQDVESNGVFPRKWPYPQKERNLNSANVPTESNPAISTRMWWDV